MPFALLLNKILGRPPKVGSINGVDVYSNKKIQSMHNTLITFTDGSTCDVATRQVVNRGEGTIVMKSASDTVTTKSKQVAYGSINAKGDITIGNITQTSSSNNVTQVIGGNIKSGGTVTITNVTQTSNGSTNTTQIIGSGNKVTQIAGNGNKKPSLLERLLSCFS